MLTPNVFVLRDKKQWCMNTESELIPLTQAARMVGLSRVTLHGYAHRGLLPVLRTPTGTMRVRVAVD